MNLFFLIAKIVTVAFFLIMFLRSDKVVWGVGLLTVTSAILLDTFLGTFGREEMIQQLGFFFYILAGALFAGGTFWLWGVLRPFTKSTPDGYPQDDSPEPAAPAVETGLSTEPPEDKKAEAEYPAHFESIRQGFSSDQIADLAFDMGYFSELESTPSHDNHDLLLLVVDKATNEDRVEDLNLAVDRIATPIPPEHLPRIEKLQPSSPPTVLRQYVVGNYSSPELEQFANDLGFDWESVEDETLHAQARGLLLFAEIRGRKGDLIDILREIDQNSSPEEPETSSG